jgi:hypothetical protein
MPRILRLALAAGVAATAVPLASAHAAPCTKPSEPVCAALITACETAPPSAVLDRFVCL